MNKYTHNGCIYFLIDFMQGFILIDKPKGITSHDVVDHLRRITGVKKIGHSGTLDPLATGLLLVAIGREYTKKLQSLIAKDKKYKAEIIFGINSTTYDREGELSFCRHSFSLTFSDIENALSKFKGDILQRPPIFSAKKIKGRKMYELARKNQTIDIEPVKVHVYNLSIESYDNLPFDYYAYHKYALEDLPKVYLDIHVSSGTYIRSIAHDLGDELGCGAMLGSLRRYAIGEFDVTSAVKLDDLNAENISEHLTDIDVQGRM